MPYFHKKQKKWSGNIKYQQKPIYCGGFDTREEAVLAEQNKKAELTRQILAAIVDLPDEIWKVFSSTHEVSNKGRVRRVAWTYNQSPGIVTLNASIHDGYVAFGKVYLHSTILETFRPNPDPNFFTCCDHVTRTRSDNRLENLRWFSHYLNQLNNGGKGWCREKRGTYRANMS